MAEALKDLLEAYDDPEMLYRSREEVATRLSYQVAPHAHLEPLDSDETLEFNDLIEN